MNTPIQNRRRPRGIACIFVLMCVAGLNFFPESANAYPTGPSGDIHRGPAFSAALNLPAGMYDNSDRVVMATGDTIRCKIDAVTSLDISYHIEQFGKDPKKKVPLFEILSYYYQFKWHNANGTDASYDRARNFVLTEQTHDAIAAYSELLTKDSVNATLLAEDAYALALAGIYDVSLLRLDQAWKLGANSPDVNYFTGQVFALMGFDDLNAAFWKSPGKYRAPLWIADKAPALLQRHKNQPRSKVNSERLMSDFKRANALAAEKNYFQALGLFHKVINYYPEEYLPYIGYSIALEQTGALESSASAIEKAITLSGSDNEAIQNKPLLERRLTRTRQKLSVLPAGTLPGSSLIKVNQESNAMMMAYAGGMFAPKMFNFNCRLGYLVPGGGNAAIDFGLSRYNGVSVVNLGLSEYFRSGILVTGLGLNLSSGNKTTTLGFKISLGISKLSKKKTSSFDVFFDISPGLMKNSITTYCVSIGKSFYFGRRK